MVLCLPFWLIKLWIERPLLKNFTVRFCSILYSASIPGHLGIGIALYSVLVLPSLVAVSSFSHIFFPLFVYLNKKQQTSADAVYLEI